MFYVRQQDSKQRRVWLRRLREEEVATAASNLKHTDVTEMTNQSAILHAGQ